MKEILLKIISFILMLIIWPLSGIGIDEDYYLGAEWHCPDGEFRNSCFDSLNSTIEQLAEKHGLNATQEIKKANDNGFVFILYNEEFYCMLRFYSHEDGNNFLDDLGIDYDDKSTPFGFLKHLDRGRYQAEMYFFSDSSEVLYDYNAQKKYVEFLDEITYLAAYDINEESIFKDSFNECITTSQNSTSKTMYEDDLVGTLGSVLILNRENYRTTINQSAKCNRYAFEALMKGSFYDSLKATE